MQIFMFHLYSDHTRAIVVASVLHSVWSELPHSIIHNIIGLTHLWPLSFHKIMLLYSICLEYLATMCCDATILQHKRSTNNIQELRNLPNTLLIITFNMAMRCVDFNSS